MHFSIIDRSIPYFRLFRIYETTLSAGTLAMAAIISGIFDLKLIFVVAIAIWLSAAGIASWNDSLDVKEDTVSHPNRPIPSGLISLKTARILGTLLVISSIIITLVISIKISILIIGGNFVGIAYSNTTKRLFLMKNLTVSISASITILLIPWAFNKQNSPQVIFLSTSIFFIFFGYEILKDIHDTKGDLSAGIITIPIKSGSKIAAIISSILFSLSCIIMGYSFWRIDYLFEAWTSYITSIILLIPFYFLINSPTIDNSEKIRLIVINLLSSSLSIVAISIYLRNL